MDGLLMGDSGTGLLVGEVGGVSFGDASSKIVKGGASVRSLVVSGICDGLVALL